MPVLRLLVSLVACAASSGDLGRLVAARAPEVRREAETALRRLARSRRTGAAPEARRLMVDIDFAQLCSHDCWHRVKNGMITLLQLMEDPQCAASFGGEEEQEEEHSNEEEPEQDAEDESAGWECMFDMCAGPSFQMICDPTTDLSVFGFDQCMIDMMSFFCDSICHASCQQEDAPARQLFCSPEMLEDEDEDDEEGMDMSPDTLADMFNFICLYNPNQEFYCQQKGMEWESDGAFEGGPVDEFPDPCNIDCSSPTGQAIAELGCCMASLVHISEKHNIMTMEEVRVAKAAMHHCGGDDAFNFCSGEGSGMTAPAELIRGSFFTDACPTSHASEGALMTVVADELGTRPDAIGIVACVSSVASACDGGRRMGSGVSVDYTVTLMGSNASMLASQKERVEARQKMLDGQRLGAEEGNAEDNDTDPDTDGASRPGAVAVASVGLALALLALAQC